MSEIDELRARLVRAEERARRAEERAAMLKIEVERLRSASAAAAAPGSSGTGGDRFTAVKRAFARLYHPDQRVTSRLEAAVRAEVYNEFWPEIEAIERQG